MAHAAVSLAIVTSLVIRLFLDAALPSRLNTNTLA